MTLTIIEDSNPILHRTCDVFNPRDDDFPLKEVIKEMTYLMISNGGMGLAAPQVGISKRFFLIQMSSITKAYINPEITWKSKDISYSEEGCLSYPGTKIRVPRHNSIKVKYQTPNGLTKTKKMKGLEARCFQHELDHLNGIVIKDKGEQ